MKKKVLVLLLIVPLTLSVALTGCNGNENAASGVEPTEVQVEEPAPTEEEAAPEPTMFDGIYMNSFTPEGYGEYVGYFHFYKNGIVYISLYNDGMYIAGFYEIVDEGVGWDPRLDGEEEVEFDPTQATTDKKIIITNLDGSEYTVVGYDSKLDMIVNLGTYYNKNFVHVLDSGHTDADEVGVNVIEYYLPGDEYSLVALKHNGTFQDSIGDIIEGTWTKDGNVYTLTDGDSGESFTVTVNEDGTAKYVGLDSTTLILEPAKAVEVQLTFTGTLAAAYGDMVGTTYLYSDDTAKLVIEYAGTTNEFEGTWVLNGDYSLTVTFDGVDYEISLNYETQTYNDFEYPTSDGAGDVILIMSQVAEE